MQPIADETFVIREPGSCPRFRPQPPFKRGQRTGDPKLCLRRNNGNRRQMRQPEPQRIHPAPVNDVADDDENQSAHHKRDHSKVQRKHSIRESLKDQSVCHERE